MLNYEPPGLHFFTLADKNSLDLSHALRVKDSDKRKLNKNKEVIKNVIKN